MVKQHKFAVSCTPGSGAFTQTSEKKQLLPDSQTCCWDFWHLNDSEVCNNQFWSHSMSGDLHRALRCNCGIQHHGHCDQLQVCHTFCTGGCSPGLSGLLFHRCLYPAQGHPANLTLSPGTGQRPLKLRPAQTYRRTLSSRRSEGLGSIQPPSQGHHQSLSKQETWLHSLHPVPRSSTSQVLFLLTIFHQRMLSCVLTSFLKTTGGIQAEGLVQGEPL